MTYMGGMFGYEDMIGTHAERKIATDKFDDIVVDTCAVTDSDEPYETGIMRDGHAWIIVEMYNSKTEAEIGHIKWVSIMKNDRNIKLKDVGTSIYGKMCRGWDYFGDESE